MIRTKEGDEGTFLHDQTQRTASTAYSCYQHFFSELTASGGYAADQLFLGEDCAGLRISSLVLFRHL